MLTSFSKLKNAKTDVTRFIAKMHLNQLYGYFGRSRELILTKNVFNRDVNLLLGTHFVKSIIQITKKISIVLMTANLNFDLIKKLKLDLDLTTLKNMNKNVKSNVAISAAVTGYARIEMIKYKTDPTYIVYYTDTDSIFINKPLPDYLVGESLGLMKNELKQYDCEYAERAIFLGNKKYAYQFIDKKGKLQTNTVFAGIKRDFLTWEQFEDMSNSKTIEVKLPNVFTHNFKSLSISINERVLKIKKSDSKILLNNKYYPKHIIDFYDFKTSESNTLKKLYFNFIILIKNIFFKS
jgi:hypothetical protein